MIRSVTWRLYRRKNALFSWFSFFDIKQMAMPDIMQDQSRGFFKYRLLKFIAINLLANSWFIKAHLSVKFNNWLRAPKMILDRVTDNDVGQAKLLFLHANLQVFNKMLVNRREIPCIYHQPLECRTQYIAVGTVQSSWVGIFSWDLDDIWRQDLIVYSFLGLRREEAF